MSQPTRILSSLIAGLIAGIILAALTPSAAETAILLAQPVGTAWLNALQMTVVPLVVSLLITGVSATAEAARAGRIAGRAIATFVALLFVSATASAVLTPLFLDLVPLSPGAGASLRAALTGAAPIGTPPPIGDLLAHIVPTNALTAATENAFLPLIVFTLVFAFALTRIEGERRRLLTGVFEALRDTMLVVINWVLWLAPAGVFALALVVGARAGAAAFGALVHYVVTVSAVGIAVSLLGAIPLAMLGARIGVARFARGALPAQAVAISTQSSLASLPAMLKGAEALGVPVSTAGLTLPIAVAIFRWTGPAMNLAVALYVARWFGVALTPGTMAAAVLVAALTSLGSVSLPGQISFVSAIAPIAAVLGVPIAPLGLLVAVETIPDIFRTLGNVTMDLAAVATVSRHSDDALPEGPAGEKP